MSRLGAFVWKNAIYLVPLCTVDLLVSRSSPVRLVEGPGLHQTRCQRLLSGVNCDTPLSPLQKTYTEEELNAKLTKRVQKAARRQAKQEELKRLHRAQVNNHKLFSSINQNKAPLHSELLSIMTSLPVKKKTSD